MSEAATLLSQLAGVTLVAVLLSSMLSSALYRPVRRLVSAFGPRTRAAATLSYALITPGVALIAIGLNSGSGAAHWPLIEHCHGDQCGNHAPLLAVGSPGHIGLVAGASLLVLGLAMALFKLLVAGRRQLLTLFNLGHRQDGYIVIDTDSVVAWCCGLLRPEIVLSRGLLQRLDTNQVEVVLAHERAHAARLDNLRHAAVRWSTSLWPAKQRTAVRNDIVADNEACCDAIALRTAPGRFEEVVEIMATQSQCTPAAHQAHFSASQADARTEAAGPKGSRHPAQAYLMLAAVWMVQVVLTGAVAHPIIEAIAAASV